MKDKLDPYAAYKGDTYTLDSFFAERREDVINKLARRGLTLQRKPDHYIVVERNT